MEINTFNKLLDATDISSNKKHLEKIVEDYPYFQLARAMYLKCLKKINHSSFDVILSQTAIHTLDKKALYFYVENIETKQPKKEVVSIDVEDLDLKEKKIRIDKSLKEDVKLNLGDTSIISFESSENITTEEQKVESTSIPVLVIEKSQKLSFEEWIEVVRREHRITEIPNKVKGKSEIIEEAIDNMPKRIKPIKQDKTSINDEIDIKLKKLDKSELMTETLAKIYTDQGKYKQAIEAYEILILKNPKKSSFFANKIQNINKIK